MYKYAACPYCRSPIEQPTTGRPRKICPEAECQRHADAQRRRAQRRQQAGIARPPYGDFGPAPAGGRDSLVRRFAKAIADRAFPGVSLTDAELAALESAARIGAGPYDLSKLSRGGEFWRTGLKLEPADRRVLQQLLKRLRTDAPKASAPKRSPRQPPASDTVGQLPEAFTRRPGARKPGQSPGWINLPNPDEKKLIDLPMPDDRPPWAK